MRRVALRYVRVVQLYGNPEPFIIVVKPDARQKSRGKHIADYSAHPDEQEVLFPPGTPFEVIESLPVFV